MTPEHTALVALLKKFADKYIPREVVDEAVAAIRALAGEVEELNIALFAERVRLTTATTAALGHPVKCGRTESPWSATLEAVLELVAERDTLRAEVAALRKDAERWRMADQLRQVSASEIDAALAKQ